MKKNIVVTGAGGFLGTYFLKILTKLKNNYNIYAIDKKRFNLPNIHCLWMDIADIDKLQNKLPEIIDYLFHFAAIKDVSVSEENYTKTYKNNTYYTLLLLTTLKDRIKRFIFTSSCAVYGNNRIPSKEEYLPLPVNFYGVSKLTGENYILTFSKIYKIKVLILRIFNMCGFWRYTDTYQGVVAKFFAQMKKGQPLTIYGDGNQSRDFIAVEDVCKILVSFLKKFPSYTILNIGTGKSVTINNLASRMEGLLFIKSKKQFKPQKKFEIYASLADNRKLIKYLPRNFTFTSLDEILSNYLECSKYQKSHA